jgi:hypothetical protein
MAAGARDHALCGGWLGELQQLGQSRRPSLMQRGSEGHLEGLQVQAARSLSFPKDTAQQCAYFARDLGLDRFGRFFSSP